MEAALERIVRGLDEALYSASPTEFRERSRRAREAQSRLPMLELAARCGVHFTERPTNEPSFAIQRGDHAMHVDIETMPEIRVAAVSHRGPYNTISEACARLGEIVEPAGLLKHPGTVLLAIYHDDVETTPQAELRSEAGITVPAGVALPKELTELHLPAGKYARTTHIGPYTLLGDVWARLMGEW
ncbi:MAG: Transcriptional regulator, AraC family, partial [Labilithrix sp.]|nr:Transcriptional regulator, AraC family [Labilithrix sp.]